MVLDSLLDLNPEPRAILDLGTGTGDLVAGIQSRRRRSGLTGECSLIGIDLSFGMITEARKKVNHGAYFIQASGEKIPVASGSVDAVISAFTLRNIRKIISATLGEVLRILRPGGSLLFLEMYVPEKRAMRSLHQVYLKTALPAVGNLVFGSEWSGNYLSETILNFWTPAEFSEILGKSGFSEIHYQSLSGGLAVIHRARKRS